MPVQTETSARGPKKNIGAGTTCDIETKDTLTAHNLFKRVLFIGTQFNNLYTAVDTPAKCAIVIVSASIGFFAGRFWGSQAQAQRKTADTRAPAQVEAQRITAVVRYAAAVQVSGATGPNAAHINGVYRPVAGEGVGGKPMYKKDGADTWIEYRPVSEYRPGTEQWQLKPGSSKGKDAAWMASLGTQKEAGVVEEVTAGWKVYDATTRVWSEQAGVRVVRCAAAVQVSGATGLAAAHINGVYRPVAGEGVGGKPVYKKDGADTWIEYRPGTEQWQLKPGSSKGKDAAWMASLGTQKEAGVVEEVTAGWKVYDATTRVWSEQAGVRVVRCAAAVQEELLAGLMAVEAKRKEDEARRKEEEESRKEKEARAVAAKRKEEEAMAAAAARAAAAAQRKEERARAAEAKRREEELLAGLRPKLDSINAEATKSHGHLVRHVFKTHPPKGNPELPSDFSQAGWCFLFVSTCVWICLHITGHHAAGS
jgi:hypothetical protein